MKSAKRKFRVPKPQTITYAGHTVVVECVSRHEQMFDTEFVYNVREDHRVLGKMTTFSQAKGVSIMPSQWHESLSPVQAATKLEAVKRLIDWLPIQNLIAECIAVGCPKAALGWFIHYKAKEREIKLPEVEA